MTRVSPPSPRGPRVLFIGAGYFPRRTAGDKNFFVDLVRALAGRLPRVAVLSVNDLPPGRSVQETPHGPVPLWNVRRALHRGHGERYFREAGGTWSYHHLHGPVRETIERHLTLIALRPRLAALVRTEGIDVIHFMDNFGPAMAWLRRELGTVAVTATALRYDPGRGGVYRRYLDASFRALDGVACLTDAYREILAELGVAEERLATLRWGPAPEFAVDAARRAAAGARYGIGPGTPLFLWAGFVQQVAHDSLLATHALARTLTARVPDLHFVFALKPESWREEFRALAGDRIHVESACPDFPALLARADCLVSPVLRAGSTVAPPLTWIEAMALGTPVATTAALGVSEAIADGETGLVAPAAPALAAPLGALAADRTRLAALGAGAVRVARERFALPAIAAKYEVFLARAVARRRAATAGGER
jgi:glycosyltransferase involved in cell wall biosynthesis